MKCKSVSGDVGPHFLNGAKRGRGRICFTPRPLYSGGKETWCPLRRVFGVLQSRSGLYGEISCTCRELNHDSSCEYIYVCNTRQTYHVFSHCELGKGADLRAITDGSSVFET